MIKELKLIKKEYGNDRRTIIKDEVTEIKLDMKAMIKDEDVVVFLTNDGYIKRVSKKAYSANEGEIPTLKPGDYITQIFNVSTLDNILIFTNLGNYLFIPVHILADSKYKEIGKHINNIVGGLSSDEKVVNAIVLDDEDKDLTMFTKNGLVKRTELSEFVVTRYSKAMLAFKLKDNDEVISVKITRPNTLFVTRSGKYLNIKSDEISVVGARASGVKGIGLSDDEVICGLPYDDTKEYLTVVTNKKTAKRVKISDLELHTRAKKGSNLIKKVKSNDYQILTAMLTNSKDNISLVIDSEIENIKNSDISIMDLNSTGSAITKKNISDAILEVVLQDKKNSKKEVKITEEVKEKEEVKVEEKKEEFVQTSLDDFYQDFKL